jgi:hypothetical protein
MEDGAHHRNGKVKLQVSEVIPGECPDNIALLDPQAFEGSHQTKYSFCKICVGVAKSAL